MKTKENKSGHLVRDVIAAMIVNPVVLGRIASRWDDRDPPFGAKFANAAGQLAVDYYRNFGQAPGKTISGLIGEWERTNKDDSVVEQLQTFVAHVSDQYSRLKKDINPDYLLKRADELFGQVKVKKLITTMEGLLDSGKSSSKAIELARSVADVGLTADTGIDVASDEAISSMYSARPEILFRPKGALGHFFGDDLRRGGYVAFEAPEKRGKTHWLIEMAYQAATAGRRVAFFGVGDMSQADMMERIGQRAAGRPKKPTEKDRPVIYPTSVEPVSHDYFEGFVPEIQTEARPFKNRLREKDVKAAIGRKIGKGRFRLFIYPNNTVNMYQIISKVKDEERQGRLPDVVVIDYMDILAPSSRSAEMNTRDQTNLTWMLGRQLSQTFQCLLITASQTKATSYGAETLNMTHFSEDKRKRGHTEGTVGINQTDKEKRAGIFRLNWIARRKGAFFTDRFVYCAGCLAISNPCVHSTY